MDKQLGLSRIRAAFIAACKNLEEQENGPVVGFTFRGEIFNVTEDYNDTNEVAIECVDEFCRLLRRELQRG